MAKLIIIIGENMKIGIKFCGGCQSKYDRGETFDNIKNSIRDVEFQYVEKYGVYDILVVISGCQIQCADIKDYMAKKILHIYNENYKYAVDIVRENLG